MAKSEIWIIIAIIAVLAVGMLVQKSYGLFAVLPAGQYNSYPDETNCIFISNVDPITSRYTAYNNAGAWIAIDKNGDGIKEAYGRYSSGFSTQHWEKIVENFNSYGDDLTSPSAIHENLYVHDSSNSYTLFKLNYGASTNAILTCEGQVSICNTNADTNCDNQVSDSEILAYLTKWVNNQITDSEILSGISAWVQS